MKRSFGPKLPGQLLDELGSTRSHGNFKPNGKAKKELGSRKERRKALRAEKKARRQRPRNRATNEAVQPAEGSDDFIADPWGGDEDGSEEEEARRSLKSTLKKQSKPPKTSESDTFKSASSRPKVSTKQKDDFAVSDAEIAALEKKLGIKDKTKLPKSFEDDGLGALLNGLDDFVASTGKRKREEYEAYLKNKRRKADMNVFEGLSDEGEELGAGGAAEKEEDSDSVSDLDFDNEDVGSDVVMEWSDNEIAEVETDDEKLEGSVDSEIAATQDKPRVRENPYRPPISSDMQALDPKPEQKYIPPALRAAATSDEEVLAKLRRQLQGLLNRLSETNILTIVKDVERVYQSNSRQHVTSTLTELLLDLMSDRTGLNDTFIILHAAFISAIYKVIGTPFGAHLLSRLVASIDKHYALQSAAATATKEPTNLMALLAELYTFHVLSAAPLLDYARALLSSLTPLNAELLLTLTRSSGAALRADDPAALKAIAALVQRAVAAAGGPAALPARTAVMADAIAALRSAKPARGRVAQADALAAEMRTRLRKVLGGGLAVRAGASEPLGVGLEDVRRAGEGGGQWWVVGGVWRGGAKEGGSAGAAAEEKTDGEVQGDAETQDVEALAKRAGMNTAVRRAVFATLLQSHDYKDCCARLTKMRLSRKQELEIPRVLLHCVRAEQTYNKYYTLVARRLCAEHRMRMAFQFALWGVFRGFGERFVGGSAGDDVDMEPDEDYDAGTDLKKVINLAKMYGDLIVDENLPITILKTLDFAYLKEKTRLLVEVVLVSIMQRKGKDEEAVIRIFSKASDALQMATGLKFFVENVVAQTDVVSSKRDKETVKKGCKAATAALSLLAQSSAR